MSASGGVVRWFDARPRALLFLPPASLMSAVDVRTFRSSSSSRATSPSGGRSRFASVRFAAFEEIVAHGFTLNGDVLTGRHELVAALLSLLHEDEGTVH